MVMEGNENPNPSSIQKLLSVAEWPFAWEIYVSHRWAVAIVEMNYCPIGEKHGSCIGFLLGQCCLLQESKCEMWAEGSGTRWWINMGIPNLWPDSTSPWPLPFLLCINEHFPFISDYLMLVVYPIFWSIHFSIQICPLMTDFLKGGQTVAPISWGTFPSSCHYPVDQRMCEAILLSQFYCP